MTQPADILVSAALARDDAVRAIVYGAESVGQLFDGLDDDRPKRLKDGAIEAFESADYTAGTRAFEKRPPGFNGR